MARSCSRDLSRPGAPRPGLLPTARSAPPGESGRPQDPLPRRAAAARGESDLARAARDLATHPEAVRRLLGAHVQRPDGRCAGCPGRAGWARAWWPCPTVHLALRADALRHGLVDEPARGWRW